MNTNAQTLLSTRLDELSALVEAYPLYIPVAAAADFLHIKEPALRASIESGSCPFGFSWRLGDRSAYKIPTITFVAWLTKGVYTLAA